MTSAPTISRCGRTGTRPRTCARPKTRSSAASRSRARDRAVDTTLNTSGRARSARPATLACRNTAGPILRQRPHPGPPLDRLRCPVPGQRRSRRQSLLLGRRRCLALGQRRSRRSIPRHDRRRCPVPGQRRTRRQRLHLLQRRGHRLRPRLRLEIRRRRLYLRRRRDRRLYRRRGPPRSRRRRRRRRRRPYRLSRRPKHILVVGSAHSRRRGASVVPTQEAAALARADVRAVGQAYAEPESAADIRADARAFCCPHA